MDDSRSARGPLMVALAVVLLAIIGGAVGLILGHTTVDTSAVGMGDPSNIPTRPGPGTTTPTSGGHPTSPDGGTPTTTEPPDTTSPTECPDRTQRLAKGTLDLVLYVRTDAAPRPSEIWICKNKDDRLFYQGHRGPKGEPLTGDNSLFLTEVTYVEATGFKATNRAAGGTTTYLIAGDTVTITHPDDTTESEHVVESHDGPSG